MQLLETFQKSSAETYTKSILYEDKLPSGLTVSSVTVSAIDLLTGSPASVVTGGAGSGTTSTFTVQGGTDGREYLITVTSTLSNSTIISDQLKMKIVDRDA